MERYINENFSQNIYVDTINKRRFYFPLLSSEIENNDDDIYVICTIGDRLDKLAFQYYQDSKLWWVIACCNPHIVPDSLYLEPGTQLRIVKNYQKILSQMKEDNLL